MHVTRRTAVLRVRQLLDDFRILTSAFPDLRDAFDPDELPIEVILKRDSQSEPYATPDPKEADVGLLDAQRDHRVDAGGAPGGNERGEDAAGGEQRGSGGVDNRVVRTDLEQQGLDRR